jgi:carbon-monoxide dehydrogenase medium subunit
VSRFDYHQPESLADAVDLAARFGGQASFLAGGTDLIVQIERGRVAPRHVIGLGRVPGLAGIEVNGRITLGARVTHRAIEQTPALAGPLRCLVEGAEVIGGHQVRNVATIGGNLVNASPAADLVPCLLASGRYRSSASCSGRTGRRAGRMSSSPGWISPPCRPARPPPS